MYNVMDIMQLHMDAFSLLQLELCPAVSNGHLLYYKYLYLDHETYMLWTLLFSKTLLSNPFDAQQNQKLLLITELFFPYSTCLAKGHFRREMVCLISLTKK